MVVLMNLLTTLETAVTEQKTVSFTYENEVRTVDIERLTTANPNGEFVTGYDQNRAGIRRFSVAKITGLTVL